MIRDLNFSPSVFGLGGAFFFLGYFALQLPSNLALDRWGARRVIAAITFFWGLCAMGMAMVHGEKSFYSARLLLRAAEAGLFQGMILYIGMWFPPAFRGRIISLFMVASPLVECPRASTFGIDNALRRCPRSSRMAMAVRS